MGAILITPLDSATLISYKSQNFKDQREFIDVLSTFRTCAETPPFLLPVRNMFSQSFSATSISHKSTEILTIWQRFSWFLATFLLRMQYWHRCWIRRPRFPIRRGYFGNRNDFQFFFVFRSQEIHHISTSGLHDLISYKKWVTCSLTAGYNFHKIWSWMDHPLPSYEAFTANTLRYIVTLVIDLLTLNSCREFFVAWPNVPPTLSVPRRSVLELSCSQSDH